MSTGMQEETEGQSSNVHKWERAVPVLLFLLCVVSWLPRMEGPLDLRWDGGTYYVLGTSLAQGKGYRLLNEPGEIEATQYPPLLPTMIAAHQLVLGTSDPVIVGKVLRVSFFAIFTGYILAAYYFLRRRLPIWWAALGTLVCLLNLFTTFISDLCFAEIPFGLSSLLFMLFAANPQKRHHAVLAGVFAITTYLFRTAGLALFVAWVGESLLRRELKQAALRTVVCLLPVVGWQAYIASVERSDVYLHPAYEYQRADYLFYNTSYARNVSLRDPLDPGKGKATTAEIIDRFLGNALQMPMSLGEGISAKTYNWDHWLQAIAGVQSPSSVTKTCLAALGIIAIAGMGVQLLRGQVLAPLYLSAYVAAVCLTPWPFQWTRYWTPLAPFLALSLIVSLLAVREYLAMMSRGRGKGFALSVVIGTLSVILLIESLTLSNFYREHHQDVEYVGRLGQTVRYQLFYYDSAYRELDRALEWVRIHAKPQDVLAASMPHWAYLQTGLKTVMPPFERDPAKAQTLLDSVPASFVIVDQSVVDFARQHILPVLRNAPDKWTLAYAAGGEDGLLIYQRLSKPEVSDTAPRIDDRDERIAR